MGFLTGAVILAVGGLAFFERIPGWKPAGGQIGLFYRDEWGSTTRTTGGFLFLLPQNSSFRKQCTLRSMGEPSGSPFPWMAPLAWRSDLLENRGEELGLDGNRLRVELGSHEILTVEVVL